MCNIGSGVSIVRVDSESDFTRISGTALGGSTFFGLCRLLTGAKSFDEALDMASRGDASSVNLLVSDIYGDESRPFGLPGDITASFFGKVICDAEKLKDFKEDDIARALIVMVTQNIAQVAFLNAQITQLERVVFTGNFLRRNFVANHTLGYAFKRWSDIDKRTPLVEPLFLRHEGCLGSLGAYLENLNLRS